MHEEKFWLLLSVKLSGEATPEELDELDELVKQHPELGWQAQLMTQMWAKQNEQPVTDDFFDKQLRRISEYNDTGLQPVREDIQSPADHIEKHYRRKTYKWLLLSGVAASIAIIFFFVYENERNIKSTAHAAQSMVITRKGSKSNVQLPDGTGVWLNADSKLTYDEDFGEDFRKVQLEGEAFFDVVKDEHRPFIIHTKMIDIKVLGTAFNVKAYEAESSTETSLIRGSVEITLHNRPQKKIILKPNEKLRVNNTDFEYVAGTDINKRKPAPDDQHIIVDKIHFEKKDNVALETLWMRNKLVFDSETLQEVMRKIERWYNVKVVINTDEDTKATQYSAIFDNESLAQVMEALKITGDFVYTINQDTVIIR